MSSERECTMATRRPFLLEGDQPYSMIALSRLTEMELMLPFSLRDRRRRVLAR